MKDKEKLSIGDVMKLAETYQFLKRFNEIYDMLSLQDEINITAREMYKNMEQRIKALEEKLKNENTQI